MSLLQTLGSITQLHISLIWFPGKGPLQLVTTAFILQSVFE